MQELAAFSLVLSFGVSVAIAFIFSVRRSARSSRQLSIEGTRLELRASWPPLRLNARRITLYFRDHTVETSTSSHNNTGWLVFSYALRSLAFLLSTLVDVGCDELQLFSGPTLSTPLVCIRGIALRCPEPGSFALSWSSCHATLPVTQLGVLVTIAAGSVRLRGVVLHRMRPQLGLRVETPPGEDVAVQCTIVREGLTASTGEPASRCPPVQLLIRTHVGLKAAVEHLRVGGTAGYHDAALTTDAQTLQQQQLSSMRWVPEHLQLSCVLGSTVHVQRLSADSQGPTSPGATGEQQILSIRSCSLSAHAPRPAASATSGQVSHLPVAVGLCLAGLRVQGCPCLLSSVRQLVRSRVVSASSSAHHERQAWSSFLTPTFTADAEDCELRFRIAGLPLSIDLPLPALAVPCPRHPMNEEKGSVCTPSRAAQDDSGSDVQCRALWLFRASRLHVCTSLVPPSPRGLGGEMSGYTRPLGLTSRRMEMSVDDIDIALRVRPLEPGEDSCSLEGACWLPTLYSGRGEPDKELQRLDAGVARKHAAPTATSTIKAQQESCWTVALVHTLGVTTSSAIYDVAGVDLCIRTVGVEAYWCAAVHTVCLLSLAHAAPFLHARNRAASVVTGKDGNSAVHHRTDTLASGRSLRHVSLSAAETLLVASCGFTGDSPCLWAHIDASEMQAPFDAHAAAIATVDLRRVKFGGASTVCSDLLKLMDSLQPGATRRQLSVSHEHDCGDGGAAIGSVECWGFMERGVTTVSTCQRWSCPRSTLVCRTSADSKPLSDEASGGRSHSDCMYAECVIDELRLVFPGRAQTLHSGSTETFLVPGRLLYGLQASYKAVSAVAKRLRAHPVGMGSASSDDTLTELLGVPNMAVHAALTLHHAQLHCLSGFESCSVDGMTSIEDDLYDSSKQGARSGQERERSTVSLGCSSVSLSIFHNSRSMATVSEAPAPHGRTECLAFLRRAEPEPVVQPPHPGRFGPEEENHCNGCPCNNPHEHGWASIYAADVALEIAHPWCTVEERAVAPAPVSEAGSSQNQHDEPMLQASSLSYSGSILLTELRPHREHLRPVETVLAAPSSAPAHACLHLHGHSLGTPAGLYAPYLYIDGELRTEAGKVVYSPAIVARMRVASATLSCLVPSSTAGQLADRSALSLPWWDRLRLHLSAQLKCVFDQCSLELRADAPTASGHTVEAGPSPGTCSTRGQKAYLLLSAQKAVLLFERHVDALSLTTEGSTLHLLPCTASLGEQGRAQGLGEGPTMPLQPILRSSGLQVHLRPTWLYHAKHRKLNAYSSSMAQPTEPFCLFLALATYDIAVADTDALWPVRASGCQLDVKIQGSQAQDAREHAAGVLGPQLSVCGSMRHMCDTVVLMMASTRSPLPFPAVHAGTTGEPQQRASLGALLSAVSVTAERYSIRATWWEADTRDAAWCLTCPSLSMHGQWTRQPLLPITAPPAPSAHAHAALSAERQRSTFSAFTLHSFSCAGSSASVALMSVEEGVMLMGSDSSEHWRDRARGEDAGPTVLHIPCIAVRAGILDRADGAPAGPVFEAYPPCGDGSGYPVPATPHNDDADTTASPARKLRGTARPLHTGLSRPACAALNSLPPLQSCVDKMRRTPVPGTAPSTTEDQQAAMTVAICGARVKWSLPIRDQLRRLLFAIAVLQAEASSSSRALRSASPSTTPAAPAAPPIKIILHRTQVALIALNPHRCIRSAVMACISDVTVSALHSVLDGPVLPDHSESRSAARPHVPVGVQSEGLGRSRTCSSDSTGRASVSSVPDTAHAGYGLPAHSDASSASSGTSPSTSSCSPGRDAGVFSPAVSAPQLCTHMRQLTIQASGLVGCTLPEDEVDVLSVSSDSSSRDGEGFKGETPCRQADDDSLLASTGVSGCEGYTVHWLKDRAGMALSGHGSRDRRASLLSTSGYAQCLPFLDPCQASLTWTREWQQADAPLPGSVVADGTGMVRVRQQERQGQHLFMPDASLCLTGPQFFTVLDVMKRLVLAHSATTAAASAQLHAEAIGGTKGVDLAQIAQALPVPSGMSSSAAHAASAHGISGRAWKGVRHSIKSFVQGQRYSGSGPASSAAEDGSGAVAGPDPLFSSRSVQGREWGAPPVRRLGYTLSALRWTLAQEIRPTITSWEQVEDALTWVTLPPPPSASPLASTRLKVAASALSTASMAAASTGRPGRPPEAGMPPVGKAALSRTTTTSRWRGDQQGSVGIRTLALATPYPASVGAASEEDDDHYSLGIGDSTLFRPAALMSTSMAKAGGTSGSGPIQVQVTGVAGWHEYWPKGSTRVSTTVQTVRILRTGTSHGRLFTASPTASPTTSAADARLAAWGAGPSSPSLAHRSGYRHTRQGSTASTLPHVLLQVQPVFPALGSSLHVSLLGSMGASSRSRAPQWAPPPFLTLTAKTLPPVFFPYLHPAQPASFPVLAQVGTAPAAHRGQAQGTAGGALEADIANGRATPMADGARAASHVRTVHTCRVNVYHRLDVALLGSSLVSAAGASQPRGHELVDEEYLEEEYLRLHAIRARNKAVAPRSCDGDVGASSEAATSAAPDPLSREDSSAQQSDVAHPVGVDGTFTRMGSVLNALRNMAPLGPGTGSNLSPRPRAASLEAVGTDAALSGSGNLHTTTSKLAHAVGTTRALAKAARLMWRGSSSRQAVVLRSGLLSATESNGMPVHNSSASPLEGPVGADGAPTTGIDQGRTGTQQHRQAANISGSTAQSGSSVLSDAAQLIVQVQRADIDEILAYFAEPTVEEGDEEEAVVSSGGLADYGAVAEEAAEQASKRVTVGSLKTEHPYVGRKPSPMKYDDHGVDDNGEPPTSMGSLGTESGSDLDGEAGQPLPLKQEAESSDTEEAEQQSVFAGGVERSARGSSAASTGRSGRLYSQDSTRGLATNLKMGGQEAAGRITSSRSRRVLRAAVAVTSAVRGAFAMPARKATRKAAELLQPRESEAARTAAQQLTEQATRPVIPEFHYFNSVRISGLRASLSARGFWGLSLDSFALTVHPLALKPKVLTWKDLVRKGRKHAGRELLRATPRLVRKVVQKTVSNAVSNAASSAAKVGVRGVAAAAAVVTRQQHKA